MAIFDPLYNKPNRVPEMQRFFQQPSERFIFARTPKDRFTLAVYSVLSAGGLAYALWGLGEMTIGVGKKPGF
ncbi:hypothetical protein RI367_003368 [Sorochytrium milnesiophthora]